LPWLHVAAEDSFFVFKNDRKTSENSTVSGTIQIHDPWDLSSVSKVLAGVAAKGGDGEPVAVLHSGVAKI
jgi:hypothetical protein